VIAKGFTEFRIKPKFWIWDLQKNHMKAKDFKQKRAAWAMAPALLKESTD